VAARKVLFGDAAKAMAATNPALRTDPYSRAYIDLFRAGHVIDAHGDLSAVFRVEISAFAWARQVYAGAGIK